MLQVKFRDDSSVIPQLIKMQELPASTRKNFFEMIFSQAKAVNSQTVYSSRKVANLITSSPPNLFFFYQHDLNVLLTKQFYKINCETIKIKINREKAFNKTMTKHIQNLSKIF